MSADFVALEALGVRVVEVPGLREGAVWARSVEILLVDPDLSDEARESATCDVLGRLAEH